MSRGLDGKRGGIGKVSRGSGGKRGGYMVRE